MDTWAKLLKGGPKTSEFYVSLIGIAGVLLAPQIDRVVEHGTVVLGNHGAWGAIGAAAIAGAYSVGRSIVKAGGLKALAVSNGAGPALVPESREPETLYVTADGARLLKGTNPETIALAMRTDAERLLQQAATLRTGAPAPGGD